MFLSPVIAALLTLCPSAAFASPAVGLHAELPTLHSPMARYSGEDVEHRVPISLGGRAALDFGLGSTRSLGVGLGARTAAMDLGRVEQGMIDISYAEALPGSGIWAPWWEAGLGAEVIRLLDHDGEAAALHLGPRFFGGLGTVLGYGRLRPALGVRASFTAATGDFELSDVEIDDETLERFYMPSVLVLAGTIGLRFQ